MDAFTIVDEAAPSRLVVFGSLPPHGRDLDLLVDPGTVLQLASALERAGFARDGREWVRFADSTAFAVELVPWDDWDLPAAELSALLEEARPIPTFSQLVRPSPRHALLVLARKLAHERTPLLEKHRRRIEEELGVDPGAWNGAAAAAHSWRLDRALPRLRRRYEGGGGIAVRRPRKGAVVAFSGLDGSGKSSQALALAGALRRLGWECEVVWVPLGSSRALRRVARSGKRVLALARGADPAEAVEERLLWNPGGEHGGRPAALTAAAAVWSAAGTVANVLAHVRAAAAPLATGKVVIFDRYVLDTVVHLRFTYGGVRHPAQERLIQLLSPRPLASFFLEVPPEVALHRKRDWDLEVLRRQADLYSQEHGRLGVRRLDGERAQDELAAEIARDVWSRLRARP